MTIKIPLSAADDPEENKPDEALSIPEFGTRYIKNPCFNIELLTFEEAMNCINMLSSIIILDTENRRG